MQNENLSISSTDALDADIRIAPDHHPAPDSPSVDENSIADASVVNSENAAESTGPVRDDGGTTAFFTASQVKAMTPAQVRANYPRIVESMKCKSFFE